MARTEHVRSRKARWCGAALGLLATPLLVWAGNAELNCSASFTTKDGATITAARTCSSGEHCEKEFFYDQNGNPIGINVKCVRNTATPFTE